ncbi:MAG: hypothetical protein KatS3mg074_865 [Meiothermus sp.]|nr:hypothetical protein Mhypo_01703 [Meiothermus hypogaeus]GIW38467.1 MAG: hypothetical protein KatS3mg074_865 [Meiothermus sp.]
MPYPATSKSWIVGAECIFAKRYNQGMQESKNQEAKQGELKPDWKDFVALVMAAYSILLPPLLLIFGAAALVLLLFYLVF